MIQLSEVGCTNILYNLAKGIGSMRPDIKVSNFPVMQIPMGLVEHIVYLFAADILQQVQNVRVC